MVRSRTAENGACVDANESTGIDAPSGGRRRVLVADDNADNRRVVARLLGARRRRRGGGRGGAEALARLAVEPFDLLLLDGMMPGLDGPATAREIRRREAAVGHPRIAIVAITASSGSRRTWPRMLEAGMDDLVVKPISAEALERALDRWLPEPRALARDVIPALPEHRAGGAEPEPRGDGPRVDPAAFGRLVASATPRWSIAWSACSCPTPRGGRRRWRRPIEARDADGAAGRPRGHRADRRARRGDRAVRARPRDRDEMRWTAAARPTIRAGTTRSARPAWPPPRGGDAGAAARAAGATRA